MVFVIHIETIVLKSTYGLLLPPGIKGLKQYLTVSFSLLAYGRFSSDPMKTTKIIIETILFETEKKYYYETFNPFSANPTKW